MAARCRNVHVIWYKISIHFRFGISILQNRFSRSSSHHSVAEVDDAALHNSKTTATTIWSAQICVVRKRQKPIHHGFFSSHWHPNEQTNKRMNDRTKKTTNQHKRTNERTILRKKQPTNTNERMN